MFADFDKGGTQDFPIQGFAMTQRWAQGHPRRAATASQGRTPPRDTGRAYACPRRHGAAEQFTGAVLPDLGPHPRPRIDLNGDGASTQQSGSGATSVAPGKAT